MQAIYRSRDGQINYYNAGAALISNQVVLVGTVVGVVQGLQGIAAGAWGTLLVEGHFDFVKDASVFAAGDACYWNATGNPLSGIAGSGCLTSTSSGATLVGFVEIAAVTGDLTARCVNYSSRRTTTIAGSVTADDITGSDANLTISGNAPATVTSSGGVVTIVAGIGGATSGAGGAITVTGGAGTAGNSAGGALTYAGGAGQGSAAGGAGGLSGGQGGATGAGGAITITSGAGGSTSGASGAIAISIPTPTSGAGAAITITGGAGGTGTDAGGAVNLVGGAAVSTGAPGEVQINGDSGLIHISEALTSTDATRTVFVALRACRLKAVKEVHSTASSSGTLQVEKCTGTQAPGSGTNLLTGTMTLAGTANTVVSGTLIATVASLTLAAGDRLSVVIAGTMTNLAGSRVSLSLAAA
jgi:hypothetical protein